jgi:hypothetical protein
MKILFFGHWMTHYSVLRLIALWWVLVLFVIWQLPQLFSIFLCTYLFLISRFSISPCIRVKRASFPLKAAIMQPVTLNYHSTLLLKHPLLFFNNCDNPKNKNKKKISHNRQCQTANFFLKKQKALTDLTLESGEYFIQPTN